MTVTVPGFTQRNLGAPSQLWATLRLSAANAVMEVRDSTLEAVRTDQLRLGLEVDWKRGGSAPDYDGSEEQVHLVDETGSDRLTGEIRATNGKVTPCRLLHPQ